MRVLYTDCKESTYKGPRSSKRELKIAGPTARDKQPIPVSIPNTVPWKTKC